MSFFSSFFSFLLTALPVFLNNPEFTSDFSRMCGERKREKEERDRETDRQTDRDREKDREGAERKVVNNVLFFLILYFRSRERRRKRKRERETKTETDRQG